MNDLTEQWRKGELLEGFYYVRCAWSDEVEIRYVHNGVDDWQEIIAEVPSYEENIKLKKLLKEANKFLKDYGFTFDGKDCAEAFKVHTKINQVLG